MAGSHLRNRKYDINRELRQERLAYVYERHYQRAFRLACIYIYRCGGVPIRISISYLVVTYVGQRTEVSGSSMETTLSDGDQLIVDKISYRFREPNRYDIVVFPYRYER